MLDFRCESCISQQLYKKRGRVCFLHDQVPGTEDTANKSGFTFRVPVFDDTGMPARDDFNGGVQLYDLRHLDGEGFLEMLWDLSERMPHLSAFQILSSFFQGVCPTAFFDEVMGTLLSAQRAATDYRLDISDTAVRTEMLGFYMTLSDMLEAFDIILAAKNAYERFEMDQAMKTNENKR